MTTLVKTYVKNLQCGDNLVVNNKPFTVKYIDGPDSIGTYDVAVIDEFGNSHIELVTGVVTITM
jgi:hypothetical protein